MTRIAFLKKYALKFAIALALLGLIAYTAGHAIGSSANSLLTTPVRAVTDRRIASAEAYLFRDEEVLRSDGVGLVDEMVESGAKVSRNSPVVQVYQTDLAEPLLSATQQSLDSINRSLRILRDSAPARGDSEADANSYRSAAQAAYVELCTAVQSGDVTRIAEIEERMLIAINRYLILSGKTDTLAGIIGELETRKANLLGSGEATLVFNETQSGTFYGRGYVDGYEDLFSLSALEGLSAEGFDRLRMASPTSYEGRAVGKMAYGYEWYLVMELPTSVASGLEVGQSYEITFPENGGCVLELTVERRDGGMVVLRSDDSPEDFIFYRVQTAQITVAQEQGYYLPESALYTVNGDTGVYVLENSTAYFRRIKVLYRGDGYCIAARAEDGTGSEIYLNDLVITSGKNLKDGKVFE
ncbi:MAG: hypothetical protein IJW29_07570 [Clostridia bacterium]|nr:hypothetical protein [Clostridia bacterium]